MACLNPISLVNPRYKKLSNEELRQYVRTNIGYSNVVWMQRDKDNPLLPMPPDYKIKVPCGKCAECKKKKRLEWSLRLIQEMFDHEESTFVTLTFDEESYEKFEKTPKKPLQLFIDRVRKKVGFRPKYWFISELGEDTQRLHFHGVIFGTSRNLLSYKVIRELWQYGFVWLADFCNVRTANYITKYMLKGTKDYKPVMLCSNGIGVRMADDKLRNYIINDFEPNYSIKIGRGYYSIPRYYYDKLITDELKVCFMLNRWYGKKQSKYYLNGVTFTNELQYVKRRHEWYDKTLKMGLSDPLTKQKNGYFYNSETCGDESTDFKSRFELFSKNEFCAWLPCADPCKGSSSWRQDYYQTSIFD